jgi:hypothetical protein
VPSVYQAYKALYVYTFIYAYIPAWPLAGIRIRLYMMF